MKKVAILIVNYNGQQYLPDLLESVFKYRPQSVFFETIVVDNASIDDSVAWLVKNYPQVTLLKQSENFGFAGGNNIGIKYALNKGYDYVMLLNQDTVVSQGYLDKLIEKIEAVPAAAAVQPKLLLYPLTDLVNSLGNVIHYLGFGYTAAKPILNNEVNYCSGAACLISAAAFKKVGLFNEELFMYHEDLDLGWRFRLRGYKNLVEPKSAVYHKYEFSRSIKKYYFLERNRFMVILQNYKIGTLVLILPALILMELGLFLFSFSNGWWLEKLKVYRYFFSLKNWQKIFKTRKQIQGHRSRPDRLIVKDFAGTIEHQEINSPLVACLVNPLFNAYWRIIKPLILW
ncbi:MAG: glycosyltransferase family 2 protein [Candidatus Komeilibacteria bacterium]|nr:glycosyltransferase family 2 protein [Candidatus Komeilibacteria bacterium]